MAERMMTRGKKHTLIKEEEQQQQQAAQKKPCLEV
jgi:hypothetical protein